MQNGFDKPIEDVSEFEQKQRQIFIELFKSGKYLNASAIYQSRKIKWFKTKIFNVFEYYKYYHSLKKYKRLSNLWEFKICLIKQKKNGLNLLKMTAKCYQESFCYS